MMEFQSSISNALKGYIELRHSALGDSAYCHELCYLRRFDAFVSKNPPVGMFFSEGYMENWLKSLCGKSSSIENEVVVIRQFLRYLRISGYEVYIPAIPKVRDDYVPYIFSDEELDRIFEAADSLKVTYRQRNPYVVIEFPVIIRLLYCCGLRIGEIVRMHVGDVDLDSGVLKMIHTKGDKQRMVPMNQLMTDILEKYCMAVGLNGNSAAWLFPATDLSEHVSNRVIKRYFEEILTTNGITISNRKPHERGPCLHCMRHIFAFKSFSKAESEGRSMHGEIPFLSVYLGHESLDETAKYLKFSSEMFPDALQKFGSFMEDVIPEVDYEA